MSSELVATGVICTARLDCSDHAELLQVKFSRKVERERHQLGFQIYKARGGFQMYKGSRNKSKRNFSEPRRGIAPSPPPQYSSLARASFSRER